MTTPPLPPTPPALTDARVRCDCGRRVSADMVTDVSSLPPEVRGERTLACDACRERWYGQGIVTRGELAMLLGAPAAQIARIVAKHQEPPRRLRTTLLAALTPAISEPSPLDLRRRVVRTTSTTTATSASADVGALPPPPSSTPTP